jgi:octaprenyl-diphosphate synthase
MSAEAGDFHPLLPSPAVPLPDGAPALDEIYAPIQAEMKRLVDFLDREFDAEEPFIAELLAHIRKYRGKQIRPALLLLIGKMTGRRVTDHHVKIAGVIELIHTATLVHDDILDDATLRRNVETLHRRWGERAGVLLGDFLYSRAFALSTQVPGMAAILSAMTNTICAGELLQIANRFRPDIGEEVYLEIIGKKTAVLYAEACSLGGVLSGAAEAECRRLHGFGMALGMAFQIIDDCLDYSGDETVAGKSLGTDLHQGKVTLPLIYLLRKPGPGGSPGLVEALRGPLPPGTERRIALQVRDGGAIEEARARARGFIESARSHLAGIPAPLRESLDGMAEYALRRRS